MSSDKSNFAQSQSKIKVLGKNKPGKPISYKKTGEYIGQVETVEGKISSIDNHRLKPICLGFTNPHDRALLVVDSNC